MMPRVSVLIPAFNYAHYLDESIQSALAQTYTDFELIIVDNNSTDNTQDIVSKYLSDPRVHYYRNEENIGLVNNWNKCLSYARGEYIKFLLADDKFYPTILQKFVDVLDKYPKVSLVACNRKEFGEVDIDWIVPFKGIQNGKSMIFRTLTDRNWMHSPTGVMFRKSNLYLGLFDRSHRWMVDWEMWVRHLTVGDCYFVPEMLCYTRIDKNQVTNEIYKSFIHIFEEYNFCKKIQSGNAYGLSFPAADINRVVKKKAAEFGRIILKELVQYRRAKSLKNARISLKILISEGVVTKAFWILFSAGLKKSSRRFSHLFSSTITKQNQPDTINSTA